MSDPHTGRKEHEQETMKRTMETVCISYMNTIGARTSHKVGYGEKKGGSTGYYRMQRAIH